jgi:hypothetical protein
MRPIQEILEELYNHPDYIASQIYNWEDYLLIVNDNNESCHESEIDGKFKTIEFSELSEEIKETIECRINYLLEEKMRFGFDPAPHLERDIITGKISMID